MGYCATLSPFNAISRKSISEITNSASKLANLIGERDTLMSVQLRIADIYIIGERAKRARHSQVCSIENRGYISICYSTGRSDIRDILYFTSCRYSGG